MGFGTKWGSVLVALLATVTCTPALSQDDEGGTTLDVYGFAMLDTGYQFNQNDPVWFDVVRPTKLPAF